MADITIPTTLVADTGTGKVMAPYKLSGDTAEFVESNASGTPAKLIMKRTEPKPTKDYAGAGRGEVRYTEWYEDAVGRLWPAVHTVTSSVPAFLTDAQKSAFVDRGTLVNGLSTSRDVLAKKLVPQS